MGRINVFLFFLFGLTHGTWKSPGWGWNLCHSSDLSCCSGNARSLTCYTTREFQQVKYFKLC